MKLVAQATSGLQGKCAAGVHAVKNPLVATSVAARHRRAAFKPARIVRVAAAEPQDGAAPVSSARSGGAIPASSLKEGQEFEGTVLSVQAFGAFVDIGADKDGLVHISQLRSTRVGAVADVVKVGDKVNVKVLSVDLEKGRVALTMKGLNGDVATEAPASNKRVVTVNDSQLVEGAVMEGTVTSVAAFGAFVNVGASKDGLVHISELGDGFIQNASDVVNVGDVVTVRVLSYDGSKLALSMKAGEEAEEEMSIAPGDVFEGQVTNSESFGVFVDIGAGRDGLVHVSQIPGDLPSVGDSVTVTVLSYDAASGRIALTMKGEEEEMSIQKGAKFEGRVTKVESFGAFVDIGAGKDGLVHVSQLGDEFVEDASTVVSVGDVVRVKVVSYDAKNGRIALTMKNVDGEEVDASAGRIPAASLQKGEVFNGTVTQVSAFGAFVDIGADRDGLVHVSQLNSEERVEDASTMVSVGDSVRVRVVSFDSEKNRLALSMKNVESASAGASNMDDEDKVAIERADNARAKSELDAFMSSCEPYDDLRRSIKFFTVMSDDGEVDEFEALPGHSFVMSEADGDIEDSVESGLFFQMRDDEDMAELSAEALDALDALNAKDLKIQNNIDVDVPLQALVEGKITAVEATGITVSFTYNGATIEGYLAREEAKVPYAKLPAADQAAWATRGALSVPAAAKAILEGVVSAKDGGAAGASDLKQTPAQYEAAFVDAVDSGSVKAGALLPSEYRSAYNIAMLQSQAVDAARLEIAQATAAPAFVDADGLDLTKFYSVGDSITSIVLAYEGYDEVAVSDDSNKVLLTMFADYEVEQDAVAAALAKGDSFSKSVLTSDDLDFTDDETVASALSAQMSLAVDDANGMDLFGLDPMEMLADEMEANEPGSSSLLFADNGVDAAAAKADAAAIAAADAAEGDDEDAMFSVDGAQVADVMNNLKKVGLFYTSNGSSAMLNAAISAGDAFPDRELDFDAVDIEALPVEYRRAFHSEGGDMSTLYDFWEDDFVAPKSREYYQKLKMRVVFDENGEGELEEYEDAPEGVELPTASADEADDLTYVMNPEHDQMVADLVKALLDDTEEEAEIPVRARRMPVVLAADVAISAADVKNLRTKTGAGMMDCKKALKECEGNVDAAVEWLRKKGLSGADKKAGRIAAEGAIVSYIHPGSRLGVMVEVNCETDFVAASDAFQNLARSVAMQLAASPNVQYVAVEDIPAEVFEKEKEIEMGREDLKGKPAAIQAKIAEGRAQKLAQEMALLPQPYLVDGSKTVEQAVKECIAAVGEKVSIRRFVKFELGEGMEKKSNDFAAEVAAATGKA